MKKAALAIGLCSAVLAEPAHCEDFSRFGTVIVVLYFYAFFFGVLLLCSMAVGFYKIRNSTFRAGFRFFSLFLWTVFGTALVWMLVSSLTGINDDFASVMSSNDRLFGSIGVLAPLVSLLVSCVIYRHGIRRAEAQRDAMCRDFPRPEQPLAGEK